MIVRKDDDGYTYARQCECQRLEYARKIWEASGVNLKDDLKRISEYVADTETRKLIRESAVDYIKNFDEIRESGKNWFVLLGQNGGGKTHISLAIAAALMNRKQNPVAVIYMPYLDTMRELKATSMDNEYYVRTVNKLNRAKLLIIDDLFKDKLINGQMKTMNNGQPFGLSEADMKHIMPILNYRYLNKLPTIISSECTPQILINLDEAIAGRILETSRAHTIITIKGRENNYRLKEYGGK